jgi:hypothetical protein
LIGALLADRPEERTRVQVVFARFIDDADSRLRVIRKGFETAVKLSDVERDGIAAVDHADHVGANALRAGA